MNVFGKEKLKFIIAGMLLFTGIILYVFITGIGVSNDDANSPDCEKCKKNKAKTYLGDTINDDKNKEGESNFFLKIFSLLTPGSKDSETETIVEKDPEKDKAINEINSLSKNVCNEENLPEDIWISPKLIEKDANAHVKELEKLIQYCRGMKTGKATRAEKKDYYTIKIRLLEERRELIKYYIDTLDGQIEDMNEKKIAEMEDRKADDKITAEEEKTNSEIEAETNRFYDNAVANTNKMIEMIDSAIKNYKIELAKL